MDKNQIKNEIAIRFRDLFFNSILGRVLHETFINSGIDNTALFVEEIIDNEAIQANIKIRMAALMSEKYTELGVLTYPDDIEVIINEEGIEAINLKIYPHRKMENNNDLF